MKSFVALDITIYPCPFIGRDFDGNWQLEDPTGKSDEEFIKVIEEIEDKILNLEFNL